MPIPTEVETILGFKSDANPLAGYRVHIKKEERETKFFINQTHNEQPTKFIVVNHDTLSELIDICAYLHQTYIVKK